MPPGPAPTTATRPRSVLSRSMAAMTPQGDAQVNNLPYNYSSAGIPGMTEISPPRQARSRATWARVLDAGVELLQEGGYEAVTIGALCERASATPPSIY